MRPEQPCVQPVVNGTPRELSASVGGDAITLDVTTVPGKVVHANGADSGVYAVPRCLVAYNPNSSAIATFWRLQGSGITPPTSQDEMHRVDIPSTVQGVGPTPISVPCIIKPGYTLHVSANLSPGDEPPYIFGLVDEYVSAGVLGYGGLIQQTPVVIGDIASPNYVTIPFDAGQLTNPINVVQDPGSNRIQVNASGVWFYSVYGTFTCTKDANNDRVIYWRTYDETTGGPLTPNPYPVNVENGTNNGLWSASIFYEVPEALVGHWFRWELGGSADAFAGITLQKAGVLGVRISPDI